MIERNILSNSKLSVKQDIVFKRIFAHKGNEIFLIEFLSALLNLEIKQIEIMHDIHLEKDIEKDKLGIIDVRAIINDNSIVNIEIQLKDNKNIIPRSTFYGAKIFSSELKKREEYQTLKPVIVICILDYELFPYKEYINNTVTVLKNHKEHVVNEYLNYYYIELPKFRKENLDDEDITSQWLTFIDSENSKEIEKVMKKNDTIKKANDELEYLEGDEAFKRKVELREKYERDIASAKYCGKEIGKKIGKKERNIEIAKNMLNMKMDINIICKVTGLTKEEIGSLK